jgi:pimeloyl-ACP methyl ester carboxylesterase
VLVGQGFGGYNVRLYADTYPNEVGGLVLVDAFHEDMWERSLAVLPPKAPDEDAGLAQLRTEVETPNPNDNPEGIDWEASAAQVRAAGSLGDLPLVVLTRGRPIVLRDVPADVVARLEEVWRELQQDLTQLSTNSTHIIAEESNSLIQEHQPELVVDAIRQVVEAVREHEGDGR